jgi:hypothetical protein
LLRAKLGFLKDYLLSVDTFQLNSKIRFIKLYLLKFKFAASFQTEKENTQNQNSIHLLISCCHPDFISFHFIIFSKGDEITDSTDTPTPKKVMP